MGMLRLTVVEKNTLDQVHEATVNVLEQTGIAFRSEEAKAIFKKHGAKLDGDLVKISRSMLEEALKFTPKSFTWHAKNPASSVLVGEGQKRTLVSPNNGPVYVQDLDGGRRLGTMLDLINNYKLCQYSSTVDIIGAIPIEPSDIDTKTRHLNVFHQLLRHVDKPLIGFADNAVKVKQTLNMLDIALGKDYVDTHPCLGVSVNPLSPLCYDDVPCETLIEYAKRGQVVFVLTCALAGVTSPISLLGTAVMQNAEILAGLVLTQLVNQGTPFLYSPASTVANMRNATYITGSPEANLINIVGLQLAQDLYKIPCRSMAGLTDSKVIDCQAGYETMQNLMMLILGGAHVINECLGVLDSIMITSYEKLILDLEMIERTRRIAQGVDTSAKALSVEVIQEVGPNGSYLIHPNTCEYFRERWRPSVSTWDSYADWAKKGSEDVAVTANRTYKEMLAKAPDKLIDSTIDKQLLKYMESNQ
jgi:trimethylamine---corrinoid protein Co-methyltransferase